MGLFRPIELHDGNAVHNHRAGMHPFFQCIYVVNVSGCSDPF